MAIAKFKTEEERARLDEIFAEVEAAERGETLPQQAEPAPATTIAEQRLERQDFKQIVGCTRQMLNDHAFKTKWERVLAKTLVKVAEQGTFIEQKELAQLHSELNVLRNLVQSIDKRLENATRTAKEQDNHHYYKTFAEAVRTLLDNL